MDMSPFENYMTAQIDKLDSKSNENITTRDSSAVLLLEI